MEKAKDQKAYIDFISDDNYFLLNYESLSNQPLLISKKSSILKNVLAQLQQEKINVKFIFRNFLKNDFMELIFKNNDLIVFYSFKNGLFLNYNLLNDKYFIFDISNDFISDETTLKEFLLIDLKNNNFKCDNKIIDIIIDNFICLYN